MLIFCAKKWVYPSGAQRFCKNDSDSSHWLWPDSSHSVKIVTRVESQSFSTWLESSPSHQKSWIESSHLLESRHHCWLNTKTPCHICDPTHNIMLCTQSFTITHFTLHCYRIDTWAIRHPWLTFVNQGCQVGSFGAKNHKFGSFEKQLAPKFSFGYLATFWLFCNISFHKLFLEKSCEWCV